MESFMHLAHKIRLDPTPLQASYFEQAAGNARFAYNWALAKAKERMDENNCCFPPTPYTPLMRPRQTGRDLDKRFNAIKEQQFPFMQLATKHAGQRAILNLGGTLDRWRSGQNAFPKFHKKGERDSFYIGKVAVKVKRVQIPGSRQVKGFRCKMRERLRFDGDISYAVVSKTAGRWFVSILVDTDGSHLPDASPEGEVGIDLGIRDMATLSNGEKYKAPKPLKNALSRLRFLSKAHSRKQKGSANRRKFAMRLAKLHARIANIRNDYLHKLSTALTRRFKHIRVENLRVKNMVKQRSLSRAIVDMGWGEFVRQLTYKAHMRGGSVEKVNPRNTSRACSKCGAINDKLGRGTTKWQCAHCGAVHDRDVNAAINILAGGLSVTACGEMPMGSSVKQEQSSIQLRLFEYA